MMGIYKIENIITNEIYIGSALDFQKRKWSHQHELRKNKHHSPILQNSWNKYGEENFKFLIIEDVQNKEDLIKREQHYIDILNPKYNCCKIAGSPLGVKHTLQSRINMSNAHLGKKLSKESIEKRSLKQSGINHPFYNKKRSVDVCQKMSEGMKKFYLNGGISSSKGRKKTEKEKKKISEKLMIPICQFDKNNNFIREWKGCIEAARELNKHSTNINQCCNGKLKTSGGFIWKFKKDCLFLQKNTNEHTNNN